MSSTTILTSRSGGVTRLTLNRPDKLNAFTRAMHAELREGLTAAGADPDCRVVVLTGAGRAFSAGQDLADTGRQRGGAVDAGKMLDEAYNPLIKMITTLEKPVIAAVNGIAAGAAANIALACDLVYAARSASFLQAFARIGAHSRRRRHLGAAAPGRDPRGRVALPCWPSRCRRRRPRPGA